MPIQDPDDRLHAELVQLRQRGEQLVAELEFSASDHGVVRRRIRQAIADSGLGAALDTAVLALLGAGDVTWAEEV